MVTLLPLDGLRALHAYVKATLPSPAGKIDRMLYNKEKLPSFGA